VQNNSGIQLVSIIIVDFKRFLIINEAFKMEIMVPEVLRIEWYVFKFMEMLLLRVNTYIFNV